MKIEKAVKLSASITPIDLGSAFASADAFDQVDFLTAVAKEFLSWKPDGCRNIQIQRIADELLSRNADDRDEIITWLNDLSKAITDRMERGVHE